MNNTEKDFFECFMTETLNEERIKINLDAPVRGGMSGVAVELGIEWL